MRKALSGVARVHGRFGLQAAVQPAARRGRRAAQPRRARPDHDVRRAARALRGLADAPAAPLRHRGLGRLHGGDRPVVAAHRGRPRGDEGGAARAPAAAAARTAPAPARRRRGRAAPRVRRPWPSPTPARPALFEALRAHRLALARGQACRRTWSPATARCATWPRCGRARWTSSLAVHGIGPAKAERYGRGFLDVIERALSSRRLSRAVVRPWHAAVPEADTRRRPWFR